MNGPIFLENTVPMRPKTPEYILNHNDYPIKTSPRTPSGSPRKSPSEEKPLQQPSMDTILAAMEKVDKDIVVLDRVVKKVNNELQVSCLHFNDCIYTYLALWWTDFIKNPLFFQKQDKDEVKIEGIPVTPRKTEVSENVSLIEKIYEENRLKAEKATMSMYHLGCPLLEPNLPGVVGFMLYNIGYVCSLNTQLYLTVIAFIILTVISACFL